MNSNGHLFFNENQHHLAVKSKVYNTYLSESCRTWLLILIAFFAQIWQLKMDPKKYFWQVIFPTLLNLASGIAALCIGVIYAEDDNDGNATYYLKVSGSYLITTQSIKLIIIGLGTKYSIEKVEKIVFALLDLGYFAVIIWGSVIVFGEIFNNHQLRNKSSYHFLFRC